MSDTKNEIESPQQRRTRVAVRCEVFSPGDHRASWSHVFGFISSKAISPPVTLAIADRGPHQRHHDDGYDGRHDCRDRVSVRVAIRVVAASTIIISIRARSITPSTVGASIAVITVATATCRGPGLGPGRVSAVIPITDVPSTVGVARLRPRGRWLGSWVDISTVGIARLWPRGRWLRSWVDISTGIRISGLRGIWGFRLWVDI